MALWKGVKISFTVRCQVTVGVRVGVSVMVRVRVRVRVRGAATLREVKVAHRLLHRGTLTLTLPRATRERVR